MGDRRVRPRDCVRGAGTEGAGGLVEGELTSVDSQFTRLAVAWGSTSVTAVSCADGELALEAGPDRFFCRSTTCPSWLIAGDWSIPLVTVLPLFCLKTPSMVSELGLSSRPSSFFKFSRESSVVSKSNLLIAVVFETEQDFSDG